MRGVRKTFSRLVSGAFFYACGCGSSEHPTPLPAHGNTGGALAGQSSGAAAGRGGGAHGGTTNGGAAGVTMTAGTAAGGSGTGGASHGDAGQFGSSGEGPSAGTDAGAECPSGTSNHTAGSRIHGRYAITEDGNRYWREWYDSELNVPCEFYALRDGQMYCAPRAGSLSSQYFTDAGCTEKAYTRGSYERCAAMDFIFLYDPPECALPPFPYYRFFDLGAPVSASAELYVLSGSECVTTTPPANPLYRLGPEVDYPARFVAATFGPLSGTGRLQGYGMSANDGTRQLTRWHDNTLGVDCRLDLAEDGARRCLPLFTSYVQNFADAACSTPVAEPAYTCDDAAPAYAVRSRQQECPAAPNRWFTSGARFDDPLYTTATGTCAALTTDTADAVHYATKPAPPTSFQDVQVSVDLTAPGRLKPQFATTDGACWFDGTWDSELETKCFFDLASDGVERCLPSSRTYQSIQLYEDDACNTPRLYTGPFQCGSTPIEPFAVVATTSDNCTYTSAVYRTGALVTDAALGTLWQKSAGQCIPARVAAGDYAPLALMNPSEFVAATIVTE